MLKEPETQPSSRWNWMFWWRIDQDDVDWQAAHYNELTWRDSFKGWSAIMLIANAALSTVLILASQTSGRNFLDPAIMLGLAALIYFGHRWAMIGAMIFWTLEKLFQFYNDPGTILIGVFWWSAYLHVFYMAFLVERRRRVPRVDVEAFD